MTTRAARMSAIAVAGAGVAAALVLLVHSRPGLVPIVLPSGRVIRAELARTPAERARGLMFRRSMPWDHGMLITFPAPGRHGIWTRQCRFPLDIVWLDDELRVVDIAENVSPCGNPGVPRLAVRASPARSRTQRWGGSGPRPVGPERAPGRAG